MLGCILFTSCKQEPPSPAFITSPGSYTYFDHQLTITVGEEGANLINYRIHRGKVSAGPAAAAIQKGSPWFIHAAAPAAVWVYDGANDLTLVRVDETGASKFTSSKVVPELTNQAPAEVLRRMQSRK